MWGLSRGTYRDTMDFLKNIIYHCIEHMFVLWFYCNNKTILDL